MLQALVASRSGMLGLTASLCLTVTACGGDEGRKGDGLPRDAGGPQNAESDRACSKPIDAYIEELEANIPPWSVVDCFTTSLSRLEPPKFFSRALAGVIAPAPGENHLMQHVRKWDALYASFAVNVSSMLTTPMPPHLQSDGAPLVYPLPAATYDEHLRGWALIAAREKRLGKRIMFINFYPPEQKMKFASENEFWSWFDARFVPEKIQEAKVAEKVKAEYYIPMILETEVLVRGLGDFVNALSGEEKVSLAQKFVDRLYDTVKPHFSGIIAGHSYANYDLEPYWKSVSFAKYDQIHFGVFPQCDVDETKADLMKRLAVIKEITQRDGVAWMANEISVYEHYFAPCGQNLATIEPDVWKTVLDVLRVAEVPPIGLGFSAHDFKNPSSMSVINAYLAEMTK